MMDAWWLLLFYMVVASYCFYEKVRRTNALLKYFYYFSEAELNNIESEDKVFPHGFSFKESNYGDKMMKIFNNSITG